MKVIFDTNVLVAAFATDGLCSHLLRRANRGEFEIYVSPFILREFHEKLKTKLSLSQKETGEIMELLEQIVKIVNPEEQKIKIPNICRDKDDNFVIACGIASEADYIVTGDKELLKIKEYKSIRIINPREFELLFD